jgi:FHA domain
MSTSPLDSFALQVVPGPGLVGRFAAVCLVIVPTTPQHQTLARELLELATATPEGQGRALVRRIVGALAVMESDETFALCALCVADGNLVLVLQGRLRVSILRGSEHELLFGGDVVSWIERRIELPVDRLVAAVDGAVPPTIDAVMDLRRGVVAGSGFMLNGSREDEPVRPTFSQAADLPFESFMLNEAVIDEARAPLAIAGPDDQARLADDNLGEVAVTGCLCSRGHFNSPHAIYCSVCGISMLQLTRRAVQGVRPPLGYLVLDDGATYVVDRSYVIGRQPDEDPDVRAGRAYPLVLAGPDSGVAPSHACILLDDWDVKIIDRRSGHSTRINGPGDSTWTQVGDTEPVTLRPGARILIGKTTMVFDSHHDV